MQIYHSRQESIIQKMNFRIINYFILELFASLIVFYYKVKGIPKKYVYIWYVTNYCKCKQNFWISLYLGLIRLKATELFQFKIQTMESKWIWCRNPHKLHFLYERNLYQIHAQGYMDHSNNNYFDGFNAIIM